MTAGALQETAALRRTLTPRTERHPRSKCLRNQSRPPTAGNPTAMPGAGEVQADTHGAEREQGPMPASTQDGEEREEESPMFSSLAFRRHG